MAEAFRYELKGEMVRQLESKILISNTHGREISENMKTMIYKAHSFKKYLLRYKSAPILGISGLNKTKSAPILGIYG